MFETHADLDIRVVTRPVPPALSFSVGSGETTLEFVSLALAADPGEKTCGSEKIVPIDLNLTFVSLTELIYPIFALDAQCGRLPARVGVRRRARSRRPWRSMLIPSPCACAPMVCAPPSH